MPEHWLIRVGDGINFKNSKYPFWGIKRGKGGCFKTVLQKINEGDILWFFVSKSFGGIIIGMAVYTHFYDRLDEPLVPINTRTNEDQHWTGDQDWTLEIHYKNLYITERQSIECIIQCGAILLEYKKFTEKIKDNLYEHHKNFIFYAQPTRFLENNLD